MPSALFTGTPGSDLSGTGDTFHTNQGVDRNIPTYDGIIEAMVKLYAGNLDLKDPRISPIYGDFVGFPPTMLVTGTRDLFLSNTVRTHTKLRQAGRQPGEVKRTMMALVFCGRNETELKRRADFAYRNWIPELTDQPFDSLLEALDKMLSPLLNRVGATFSLIVGTPDSVVQQIRAYAEVGVEELILQWFDVDDIEGLQMYAEHILPRLEAKVKDT